MPQATDELRKEWADANGEPTDEIAANYLQSRGFMDDHGTYRPKIGHEFNEKDWSALNFMADEWDYDFDSAPWAPTL